MYTKKETIDFLKLKLGTNPAWALNAMKQIYARQTEAEKRVQMTTVNNGVGFSGVHGEIMSSLANQYIRYNRLSDKQMAIVFKIMPKYWRQIFEIMDVKKMWSIMSQEKAVA